MSRLECIAKGRVWSQTDARCIEEYTCLEDKSNVINQARECTKEVPTEEGIVGNARIYSCGLINGEYSYWNTRLNRCVSRTKCVYSSNSGAVIEDARLCVSQAEWLQDSPFNYVTLNFAAKQVNDTGKFAYICGTGATMRGRYCTCSSSTGKDYYNITQQACVAAPTEFDGTHNIKYNIAIYANGQQLYRHFVVTLDECTEVDNYRTTNYEECIANCPDYTDNGDANTKGRYINGEEQGKKICMCSSNPKMYARSANALTSAWTCVSFEECVADGFIDITWTKCLPSEDKNDKCSGQLSGDTDIDANGKSYLSYRQIQGGVCRCLFGVGPGAEQ